MAILLVSSRQLVLSLSLQLNKRVKIYICRRNENLAWLTSRGLPSGPPRFIAECSGSHALTMSNPHYWGGAFLLQGFASSFFPPSNSPHFRVPKISLEGPGTERLLNRSRLQISFLGEGQREFLVLALIQVSNE